MVKTSLWYISWLLICRNWFCMGAIFPREDGVGMPYFLLHERCHANSFRGGICPQDYASHWPGNQQLLKLQWCSDCSQCCNGIYKWYSLDIVNFSPSGRGVHPNRFKPPFPTALKETRVVIYLWNINIYNNTSIHKQSCDTTQTLGHLRKCIHQSSWA